MNYYDPSRGRQNARRWPITLLAVCLPLIAAIILSGSRLAGPLQIEQIVGAAPAHAAGAISHAAPAAPENCNVTANAAVSITDSSFNPASISVNPGTRVTWTNNGSDRHRVRDVEHNLFDSDDLDPGQSFSYTFCAPGRYDYEDARNGFRGVVIVSGSSATGTPAGTGTPAAGTPTRTSTPVRTGTPGGMAQVNIFDDDGFDPAHITVGIGTTVRWTNYHDDEHTITSPGNFNSGDINQGQSWDYTFNTPGTFSYFCAYHEQMQGSVTVTCDNCTPTPAVTPTVVGGNVDVAIVNFGFNPQNVTVLVGSTVRWTNQDPYPHTATSPGNFDSGTLNQGQSWSYTFNNTGTFSYFCAVHPGMTGTITVTSGGGGTPTPPTTPQATATRTNTPQVTNTPGGPVSVTIQNFAFSPQNLTIAAGTTVRWTNQDSYAHTATSPGNFDSGNLNQGQSWQFTFNTPGTFSYFCALHPAMTGTIVVTGGGATATPTAAATGTSQATSTRTNTPQATGTPGGPASVAIQNFAFSPQNLTIASGTTVRWTNQGAYPHTATSPGNFDSGNLNQGQSWQHTFNTPGTYSYFCALHPTMTGSIIVTGGSVTNTPQATQTAQATGTAQASSTPQATGTAQTTGTPAATATASPTMVPGQRFRDVFPGDYFYEAANWLVDRGIISGYSDGTFRPYNNTTRGQVTKMVVLGEGWPLTNPQTPTFNDVQADNPFYTHIETAVQRNVISGYADDTFRPNNSVTRGQLTKIIVLARGWNLAGPPAPTFTDVQPTNPFYTHIETAVQHGIISGYADRTFRPGNNATRGQISKIIYNALTAR